MGKDHTLLEALNGRLDASTVVALCERVLETNELLTLLSPREDCEGIAKCGPLSELKISDELLLLLNIRVLVMRGFEVEFFIKLGPTLSDVIEGAVEATTVL